MHNFFLSFCILVLGHLISAQNPVIKNNAVVEMISTKPSASTNYVFLEGPLWVEGEGLLFSDMNANKIYKWTESTNLISVFFNNSNGGNGLAFDAQGRLTVCKQSGRMITRIVNNQETTIVSTYNGKKLNSPNDIVLRKKSGSLYFTDPPYGLPNGTVSELGYNGVFRLNTAGKLTLLDNTIARPNGITLSPDENKLYVSDAENRKIYQFNIVNDSTINNKTQIASFTPTGYADGLKTDANGYLYCTGPLGIWVVSPTNTVVDTILIPGDVTNCTFGGAKKDVLFVTTGNSKTLYRVKNKVVTGFELENEVQQLPAIFKSIYPNPSRYSSNFEFDLAEKSALKVEVIDRYGKVIVSVFDGELHKGNHLIPFDNQIIEINGIYFVQATLDGKHTETKLFQIIK